GGSAGIDVVTAESVLIEDEAIHLIPTTSNGPLGHGLAALLLGRSSATVRGIFVQPGVIDADYCGVIKIMVHVFSPPLQIPKGSVIAQLIPFTPQVPTKSNTAPQRTGGFGSTGLLTAFVEVLSASKPTRLINLTLNDFSFQAEMMLDTGSDITIIL
ncbi:POK9 protein, partial [Rhodinocichla rosea]|nr:POK9 protein [Rhodinocichla rosea]